MAKKTIIFIIESLSGGGAERVLIDLLKTIDSDKFDVTLAAFSLNGRYKDEVPENIVVENLARLVERPNLILVALKLRSYFSNVKPDLVISFMPGANCPVMRAILTMRSPPRVILTEHNNPESNLLSRFGRLKRLLKILEISLLYRFADKLVCVSEGVGESFRKGFGLSCNLISIINNPVDIARVRACSEEVCTEDIDRTGKVAVAVGRLVRQKGYSDLIAAFKLVRENIVCKLYILGEGPEKESLYDLAKAYGLENDIKFIGFKKNPWSVIKQADVYVSSSRWEGFHLTLVEAMACGVPVVATDCDYGPREIVTNNINGLLVGVGNVECIADAILSLFLDEKLSEGLVESGSARCLDYDTVVITKQYELLIETILENIVPTKQ